MRQWSMRKSSKHLTTTKPCSYAPSFDLSYDVQSPHAKGCGHDGIPRFHAIQCSRFATCPINGLLASEYEAGTVPQTGEVDRGLLKRK